MVIRHAAETKLNMTFMIQAIFAELLSKRGLLLMGRRAPTHQQTKVSQPRPAAVNSKFEGSAQA